MKCTVQQTENNNHLPSYTVGYFVLVYVSDTVWLDTHPIILFS